MRARILLLLLGAVLLTFPLSRSQEYTVSHPTATFSVVGWDSVTHDVGVAVASHSIAIGAIAPYARAGVGALVTQALANSDIGSRGIDFLMQGLSAQQAALAMMQNDPDSAARQIAVVDGKGNTFSYTGAGCQPLSGSLQGSGFAVAGDFLTSNAVLTAMARTFDVASGSLAERLLSSLEAGEKAGGERGGLRSACLLVVREKAGFGPFNDRLVDLRVDDDSVPLAGLRRIYNLWERSYLLDAHARAAGDYTHERNFAAGREERERIASVLNRMLKEKPDDPETLNRVASMLTLYDIDRNQALELAKRAAKLAPGNLEYLSTLAECHYSLGHFDEAIAIGSDLVAKDPGNDSFWKRLQKYRDGKQKSGN